MIDPAIHAIVCMAAVDIAVPTRRASLRLSAPTVLVRQVAPLAQRIIDRGTESVRTGETMKESGRIGLGLAYVGVGRLSPRQLTTS
jgi:hypothetical protein